MTNSCYASELEQFILGRKQEFFYINGDRISCIVRNLKFVYQSVIASENLLSCAIEQLMLSDSSAYRDAVLSYFVTHLEEERGHADWLANDLTTHGVDIDELDNDAMAMIGCQYYMIYHKHPYCLLGYMAVVEGTPTPISEIERLEQAYGRKLFRFARFHSIKDEEHKIELFELIDQVPPQFKEAITSSAQTTLNYISKAAKHWI